MRERAEFAPLVVGAKGLGGVVENEQIFRLGNLRDRIVVGRQSEQIDRNDCLQSSSPR